MMSPLFRRIMSSNHQQWGSLIGMLVGCVLAIYALPYLSMASLPWIGTLHALPLIFIKIIAVPFIGGMFANLFSNLGSGLDILTNGKTLIHYLGSRNCIISKKSLRFLSFLFIDKIIKRGG